MEKDKDYHKKKKSNKKEEPVKGKTLTGEPAAEVEIDPEQNVQESRQRTAVISFGRLNPPTLGHSKLVNKLVSVARKENGTPMLFLSHSHDKKKNPLTYDQKVSLAQKAFGRIVVRSNAKNIIQVLQSIERKFDRVMIVVGDDRVREFDILTNKYNGKEYTFDRIEVISAGERDPDATDVTGMSASKMRAAAIAGDLASFRLGLPKALKNDAEEIFMMIRNQMGVTENDELLEELLAEISVQQRLKRAQRMRRLQPRLRAARKRAEKRGVTASDVKRRSQRRARSSVKKTFQRAGGDSVASRKRAETMADKRKALIARTARRLRPKVRRDHSQRR